MAPMHMVSEEVTKASTKRASLAFPVLNLSQVPKRSKPSSIPRISPITVPTARQSTMNIERPLVILQAPPVSEAVISSIPSIAPAIAIKSTLTPQTTVMESCCSCLKILPAKCPTRPPATTAAVLISVPAPAIFPASSRKERIGWGGSIFPIRLVCSHLWFYNPVPVLNFFFPPESPDIPFRTVPLRQSSSTVKGTISSSSPVWAVLISEAFSWVTLLSISTPTDPIWSSGTLLRLKESVPSGFC